jgi:cob(I)alamin adenosyltransferase
LRGVRIYTRTGDGGETSLMGGRRVTKDDRRVAAYGDVDETNAAIGAARATHPAELADALLQEIQRDLFAIGGALATPEAKRLPSAKRAKVAVTAARVHALEKAIDTAEAALKPLKQFVLPGGAPKAAAFHVARTVCRRAERAVVRLIREERVAGGATVLIYLNRLSDLLFVLARLANLRAGEPDVTW